MIFEIKRVVIFCLRQDRPWLAATEVCLTGGRILVDVRVDQMLEKAPFTVFHSLFYAAFFKICA
jgi:hypothetical protein